MILVMTVDVGSDSDFSLTKSTERNENYWTHINSTLNLFNFWQAIVRWNKKKKGRERKGGKEKNAPKLLRFFSYSLQSVFFFFSFFSISSILLRNLFTINVNELFAYENVIDLETCFSDRSFVLASISAKNGVYAHINKAFISNFLFPCRL